MFEGQLIKSNHNLYLRFPWFGPLVCTSADVPSLLFLYLHRHVRSCIVRKPILFWKFFRRLETVKRFVLDAAAILSGSDTSHDFERPRSAPLIRT
jgi:hypothetical protein